MAPVAVVVCGEALIDRITSFDRTVAEVPGGGPYNTARALGRLGVPVAFAGNLSTDASGHLLKGGLAADGVDLSFVTFGREPTTVAEAQLDRKGNATFRFAAAGTSAPNLMPAALRRGLGPEVKALHVGSLGLVLEPMASTLAALLAEEAGRRFVLLDPNIRPALIDEAEPYRKRIESAMKLSTMVKASDDDIAWLYPGLDRDGAARRILELGPSLVVITLGAEGAAGYGAAMRAKVDALPCEVVDTVGAGDIFGAALLAWLHDRSALDLDPQLDEGGLEAALGFACRAACFTCGRPGAAMPTRADIAALSPSAD